MTDSVVSADALTDLQMLAKEQGIPLDEAYERFAWQDGVAIAVTEVEEEFKDSFAGAEIISEVPPVVEVRFVGKPSEKVADFFAALPPGIEIRLQGDEALSQVEINQLVAKVHAAAAQERSLGLSAEYDHDSGVVRVSTVPPPDTDASALARAIQSRVAEAKLPRADVVVREGEPSRGDARNGGGRLELNNGQAVLECTAGFNVVNGSGSTTGVATAGHCGNSLTHENLNGQTEYYITFVDDYISTYGDFQWGTSTDTEPDDFYFDSSVSRDSRNCPVAVMKPAH